MMDQKNELPDGWALTTLGHVCKTTSGGTPSRKLQEYFQGDIPWVKSGELPDNVISHVEEYISKEALDNSSAKLFPEDTLLIALYGATVGKLGILKKPAATNQAICAIFPKVNLCTKYIFWYLRFIRSYLISQAVGGAQPNINQSILQSLPIQLAPLPEQHRIVAEIEKQFSRFDEAVAGLKCIQANLKRYRASVLKAAVEGKLTAEWRKQHPNTETAKQLLARILKERRMHWEQAELEKMQAAGKPPKDDQWKQKYKEPFKPDMSDLPTLPEGWVLTTLGHVCKTTSGGTPSRKFKEYFQGDIPWVKSGELPDNVVLDVEEYITKEALDNSSAKLFPEGTLLIALYGATVGKLGILKKSAATNQAVCAIFPKVDLSTKYLFWYLRFIRSYLISQAVGGAQPNINQSILQGLPIPFAPLQEQAQIISEVERRLSIADEVEQQINTNLKRAERMRQAILKKAFSGRLVPQDTNDEPAGVLLEKIKQAQRA